MKVEIYQMPIENHMRFRPFSAIQSNGGLESVAYDKVWEGDLEDGMSLEDIYEMFNVNQPEDYKASSLSVSDIVVLNGGTAEKDGAYFCDRYGFKPVDLKGETEMNDEENVETTETTDLMDITPEDDKASEDAAVEQMNGGASLNGSAANADDEIDESLKQLFLQTVPAPITEGRFRDEYQPDVFDNWDKYDKKSYADEFDRMTGATVYDSDGSASEDYVDLHDVLSRLNHDDNIDVVEVTTDDIWTDDVQPMSKESEEEIPEDVKADMEGEFDEVDICECPNCGAHMEYIDDGHETFLQCPNCSNETNVPEEYEETLGESVDESLTEDFAPGEEVLEEGLSDEDIAEVTEYLKKN